METVLPLSQPTTEEPASFKALLRKCAKALFEPARFFRQDLPAMKVSEILAFGIANSWAAAACSFFLHTLNSLLLSRMLEGWMQRMLSEENGYEMWGISEKAFLRQSGSLILSPFFYLLHVVLFGFMLFLFSRLLIEDRADAAEPVTFQGSMKIQAVALVGNWFMVVPVFGGILSLVASMVLVVTGVRERFGVSTRRATAVVLAPYLLLILAAIFLVLFAFFAFSQIPLDDFFQVDGLGFLGR